MPGEEQDLRAEKAAGGVRQKAAGISRFPQLGSSPHSDVCGEGGTVCHHLQLFVFPLNFFFVV